MIGESYRFTRHYSHENTVKGNIEFCYQEDPKNDLSSLENELVESLTEFIRKQSKVIYRELESAYYVYTSRESAIDMIEANEYTFLENGKRSDQFIGANLMNKIAILQGEKRSRSLLCLKI